MRAGYVSGSGIALSFSRREIEVKRDCWGSATLFDLYLAEICKAKSSLSESPWLGVLFSSFRGRGLVSKSRHFEFDRTLLSSEFGGLLELLEVLLVDSFFFLDIDH